jgi:hypothetical protein
MGHVWQERSHVGAPQLLLSYLWTSPHFHPDFSLDVHLTLSRFTLLPPSSTLMAISVWIQPQELIRGAGPLSDQNSFNRKTGNVTFWKVRVVPTAALGLLRSASDRQVATSTPMPHYDGDPDPHGTPFIFSFSGASRQAPNRRQSLVASTRS